MQMSNIWLKKGILYTLVLGVVLVAPVMVWGGAKQIYVDKDANGSEEGTKNHPYHSISKALKNADEGDEIRVAKGTYKENITIPEDVKVFGNDDDRGDVVIKADNDDKPAVTMKHDTTLSHVTVKGGRHGIRVLENAQAHIFDTVVKESNRDGIHIDSAKKFDKKHRALIDKSVIKENARTGIYSEKRFVVLINSEVTDNRSDGIDFAAGTHAWLEGNTLNRNRGSGAKFILDEAEIWTKSNSFRGNGREGIEVNAYGKNGVIGLKKAKIFGNKHYGIARVARTTSGSKMFGNVSYGEGVNATKFGNNTRGDISGVVAGW